MSSHFVFRIYPYRRVSRNHISVLEDPTTLNSKIQSELSLGRIEGPFVNPPFANFVFSSLVLIPKKEPGKFHLIHDLSYPKASSVNTCIPHEASPI